LQLQRVPPIERQIADALFVDDFLQRRSQRLDQADRAGDRDRVGGLPDFELDVRGAALVGVEVNAFGQELPEPLVSSREAVVADRQSWKAEAAVRVGNSLPLLRGRLAVHLDVVTAAVDEHRALRPVEQDAVILLKHGIRVPQAIPVCGDESGILVGHLQRVRRVAIVLDEQLAEPSAVMAVGAASSKAIWTISRRWMPQSVIMPPA